MLVLKDRSEQQKLQETAGLLSKPGLLLRHTKPYSLNSIASKINLTKKTLKPTETKISEQKGKQIPKPRKKEAAQRPELFLSGPLETSVEKVLNQKFLGETAQQNLFKKTDRLSEVLEDGNNSSIKPQQPSRNQI